MHRVSNLFMRQSYWKYFFPKPSVQDLTPNRSSAHHVLADILFPWCRRFFMRHHIAQHAPQWVTKTRGRSDFGWRIRRSQETKATLIPNGLYCFFIKKGGGNKKVLQNVARFIENKDICSYKTKANLQKTKKNYTLWLQWRDYLIRIPLFEKLMQVFFVVYNYTWYI